MVNLQLAHVTLLVDDYDKAIRFYTEKLKFKLIEDTMLSESKRWVLVSPGESSANLLLAKAANEEQRTSIGNQTGGRVFLFLKTNNFKEYFANLKKEDVKIVREPSVESYGTVAVFADLYGNLWDLIDPVSGAT